MTALIERLRAPHAKAFNDNVAVADRLFYRRGNFNGTMDQLICNALRQQLDAQIALSPGFRWGATVLPGQPISMQDVLSETAITYPEVYVQTMTGQQLKTIMEDVCDNLFNLDPYYQQGGDMVRLGGMSYACSPNEAIGKRISDLKLPSGEAIEATKSYRIAGWASVNEQKGAPVWETVVKYLREPRQLPVSKGSGVEVRGVSGNFGFSEHG